MLNSFIAEMDKLLRRPATWVLAAVWAVAAVTFGYIIPYFIFANPPENISPAEIEDLLSAILPEQVLANVISGFPLFGGAVALVLGALAVGSEYGWETFKTVLVQRPGRLSVLSGTLLALAVLVFGLMLAALVPGAIASYVVSEIENAPADWPSLLDFAQALGAGWLILAAWAALGAMLAILLRGTALPIGLGLVYVLVIEGLIRGFTGQSEIIANIAKALPGPNAGSLAASLFPTQFGANTPGVSSLVGAGQATIVLVAYAVGFVVLSMVLFKNRDVTS